MAFGAGNLESPSALRAEAGGKGSQPFSRKPEDGTGHLVNFLKALFAIVGAERKYFGWLCVEQTSGGVDAVNANIIKCSAAKGFLEPDITFPNLHWKKGMKDARLAQLARLDDFHGWQLAWIEMKPISRHELYIVLCAGINHLLAIVLGHSQWFFTEHMHASLGGSNHKLAVHRIGPGDVNRIDIATVQARFIVVVGIGVLDLILPG